MNVVFYSPCRGRQNLSQKFLQYKTANGWQSQKEESQSMSICQIITLIQSYGSKDLEISSPIKPLYWPLCVSKDQKIISSTDSFFSVLPQDQVDGPGEKKLYKYVTYFSSVHLALAIIMTRRKERALARPKIRKLNTLQKRVTTSRAFALLATACWRQVCCKLSADLLQVDCQNLLSTGLLQVVSISWNKSTADKLHQAWF